MKLAEIQAAIRNLPPGGQDVLRIWLDEAPLDVEEDTREVEAGLLKAVRGSHRDLTKAELEGVAMRASNARRRTE